MEIDEIRSIKWIVVFMLLLALPNRAIAQEKTMIQVKTLDLQLNFIPDLGVSIDGKEYFTTDDQGFAYTEVMETHLPPKVIKIRSNDLEAESWNYSRGVLEIIIRKKSYKVISVSVKDQNNVPVKDLKVTFNTTEPVTATTNMKGEFQMPVPIDEDLNKTSLFSIKGYNIKKKQFNGTNGTFLVGQISSLQTKPDLKISADDGFRNFSLDNLDSIGSLTVFYTYIKNLEMQKLDNNIKQQIDSKFYQLVKQMEDPLNRQSPRALVGKITDSTLVKDDVNFLIDQALREEKSLDEVNQEFNNKVEVIKIKLIEGGKNLSGLERKRILSDLDRLARILIENEKKYFRNQANFNAILNSLKNGLLDIGELENQLTYSEKQRLEEQQAFERKIFIVLLVVSGLGLVTMLFIYLARRFKKQKNELTRANAEINRINLHLEELVSQKTASLEKANKELDTFLYKSSHDLKRPLTSIIGLSNVAKLTLEAKAWELFEKTSQIANDMDKMLQKLMMVSEINQPLEYGGIDFTTQLQKVRKYFDDFIKEHKISLKFEVCKESKFESFPALVNIILRNLVENALFYSALKAENRPKVEIKVWREDSNIAMSIYDNGSGIKPDVQSRVWEMFYVGNERSKGNGLGLYIAQKAAKVLNGAISLTTEENAFTEFKVILPMSLGTNGTTVE